MARAIDLRKWWPKEARRIGRGMSARLRKGRSLLGHPLRRKKIPNGRPLGYGDSVGGIPELLRTGVVSVVLSGWSIQFRRPAGRGLVPWFHFGRPPVQAARRVSGITQRERRELVTRARAEIAKQLRRKMR